MEWTVPVNDILTEKITKLDWTINPPSFKRSPANVRLMLDSLTKVIDKLGEQSAAAQGLGRVITTTEKLRNQPTHVLYLLKDPQAKGGQGDVIGMLKVGRKHLFLFDEEDKVWEVEPVCVLDFYVQKDRQRHGFGKILYDHMLQDNGVTAEEVPVDGPSPKMEQFLGRSYGMDYLMKQNNNFAIAPAFFSLVTRDMSNQILTTPVATPPVGRFTAPKPVSGIASVIHGGSTSSNTYTDNGSRRRQQHHLHSHILIPAAQAIVVPQHLTPPEGSAEVQRVTPKPKVNKDGKEESDKTEKPVEEAKHDQVDNPDKEKSPERPSTLSVAPVTEKTGRSPSPAGSTTARRDSQLTDRGYFDVKFYHNKLW